jgi:LEA14-like dessication related protein
MRKLLPFTIVGVLAGCSLIQQVATSSFQRPSLSFKEARLPRIDFQGAQLDLVFQVTNPNSVGLNLASTKYALQVEGHDVVSGAPANGLQIPGGGTAEVTFPAAIAWNEIAPAIETLFAKDQVKYRASGELGVNSPVGLVSLPLQHEGTFASPKMPDLSLGSPQIQSISLTSARLSLPLQIGNANSFPLPLGGLVGNVQIAGANVGQIALKQQAPVAAGKQTTLNIPLDVSFLSAGQAAAEAIRSGVAEMKIDATLNAGGVSLPLKVAQTVQLRR